MVLSATNRSNVRRPQDFYSTPLDSILPVLDYLDIPDKAEILDPCGGHGSIIKALINYKIMKKINECKDCDWQIDTVEIREEEEEILSTICRTAKIGDFLKSDMGKYDLVISNPPYSLAQEFIDKGLECLNENGKLVYLLRTNFLESKKRFQWWQDKLPSGIYVLHARPSFTGSGKTDATSYAWFVWDKSSYKQVIKVI